MMIRIKVVNGFPLCPSDVTVLVMQTFHTQDKSFFFPRQTRGALDFRLLIDLQLYVQNTLAGVRQSFFSNVLAIFFFPACGVLFIYFKLRVLKFFDFS